MEVIIGGRLSRQWYAGNALLEWRSDLGKQGIEIVVEYLRAEGIDAEAAPQAAEYLLLNHRFVYAQPDEPIGTNRLAFRSTLVLELFGYHLGKIKKCHPLESNEMKLKSPVRALALCVAVLERALTIIAGGHIKVNEWPLPSTDVARGKRKRRKAAFPAFAAKDYGSAVESWVVGIQKLAEHQWDDLLEEAWLISEFNEAEIARVTEPVIKKDPSHDSRASIVV
ncbi:hypothetical protein BKA70DRAFT_1453007 [Coprinopsis sp. MPI-PUGE-AT-0042]|nr:hypothetical protein BKA70DRAFT_1453007 [Coprinopsis sp. MPI-PUGE-AT-0042]